jgi:hypothetical protein
MWQHQQQQQQSSWHSYEFKLWVLIRVHNSGGQNPLAADSCSRSGSSVRRQSKISHHVMCSTHLRNQSAACRSKFSNRFAAAAAAALVCCAVLCACSAKGFYCEGGVYGAGSPVNDPQQVPCPTLMTTLGLRSTGIRSCGTCIPSSTTECGQGGLP